MRTKPQGHRRGLRRRSTTEAGSRTLASLVAGVLIATASMLATAPPATSATESDDAVVPIDWSAFTRGDPTDEDARRIRDILLNSNKYGLTTWYETRYGDQDGPYLDFGGIAEPHIRPPAEQVLGLATSIATGAYDAEQVGVSADDATAKTVRLIASLAFRHRANTADGWGDAWQSAYWAYAAGYAGWLVWDELSATEQDLVRTMVVHEADRFIGYEVPYYRDDAGAIISPGDTKAEENAWNANILQLATSMLANHQHWSLWMDKSLELMISAYSRPSDVDSDREVNGKPLSVWLEGSNMNEDGTVINHNFLHPDYMGANTLNNNAAATYSLGGLSTPAAAFFNSDVVYEAIVDMQFPSPPYDAPGGTIYVRDSSDIYYPQGNDWGTHRRMDFALFDVQARGYGLDTRVSVGAEEWERLHAAKVLEMQSRFEDGRTYGSRPEDTYNGREEWVATRAAQAYLTKWVVHQGAFRETNRAYPVRPGDAQEPTLTLGTSDLVRPGEPEEITTVFTNNGRAPLTRVELELELPAEWVVEAASPTSFARVLGGQSVQARWRVTAPDAETSQLVEPKSIASFQFIGEPGAVWAVDRALLAVGDNVALNKPVVDFSGQHPLPEWWAPNINDGRVDAQSRGWASPGNNQWVVIDLGREYTLSAIRITGEDVLDNRNVKDFVLYASPTGEFQGEEAVLHSATVPRLGHLQSWPDAFQPATARYIRFLGQNSYSNYIIVGELELFGT